MANTILWRGDENRFEVTAVESIFRTVEGFSSMRLDEPGGALIEARYSSTPDDYYVLVRLAGDRRMISISSVSDDSLQAALLLQEHLQSPLRIMNDDYTFDLKLSDYKTLDELNAAIQAAEQEM